MDDRFLEITGAKNEDDAMKEALKSVLQQRRNKVYKRDEVRNDRNASRGRHRSSRMNRGTGLTRRCSKHRLSKHFPLCQSLLLLQSATEGTPCRSCVVSGHSSYWLSFLAVVAVADLTPIK
jgi:hypothetical protein